MTKNHQKSLKIIKNHQKMQKNLHGIFYRVNFSPVPPRESEKWGVFCTAKSMAKNPKTSKSHIKKGGSGDFWGIFNENLLKINKNHQK